MPEFDKNIFQGLRKSIGKTYGELADIVAKESVAWVKTNFRMQGYQGSNGFSAWLHRKNDPDPSRKILHLKGILENAVIVFEKSQRRVTIGVDGRNVPYAKLHNEGGTVMVPVTPKLRKWAWAMYYESGGDKEENEVAGRYKGIALTKKEKLTIKIPQRQFMPLPEEVNQNLHDYLVQKIAERLKDNMSMINNSTIQ